MATITNYTTLVTAIQQIAEDDGQEFLDYIPNAIDIAEERLFKELDLPGIEEKVTGTIVASAPTLTKPVGHKLTNYLVITVDGKKRFLIKKMENYLMDYWPDSTITDVPKYYADQSDTQFVMAPVPAQNYPYELKYSKKPTKLSSTSLTNYYTENCQDILYFAAMTEMARFMKAWSQVQFWEGEYARVRDGWNIEMKRFRRDDLVVPQNPDGGPNSLQHTMRSSS